MQTLGKSGLKWTPFLLSLFVFIFLCNIPGILPIFQMPATARIAIPLSLVAARVGRLHRHRRQAPGARLLRPPALAARRADGAEAARRG